MRKFVNFSLVALAIMLCAGVFAACQDNTIPPGQCRVTFNTNGGTTIKSVVADQDTMFERPEPPTKPGKKFGGWFSDAALTKEVSFPFKLTKSLTLYAKWDDTSGLLTFEKVKFTSRTIPYDGGAHTITVSGAPVGTTVVYRAEGEPFNPNATTKANEGVNPGVYKVEADLTKAGYSPTTLKAELTIDYAETQNLQYKKIAGKEEYEVSGTPGSLAGAVIVPESYEGLPVTGIAQNAFKDRKNVTSVALPSGLKTIGADAFLNCYNLVKIVLPATVTSIGFGAFGMGTVTGQTDYMLMTIIMESAVPPTQQSSFGAARAILVPDAAVSAYQKAWALISNKIFSYDRVVENKFLLDKNGGLQSYIGNERDVAVPHTVSKILTGAFSFSPTLNMLTIPDSVTDIGVNAFVGCPAATVFVNGEEPAVLEQATAFADVKLVVAPADFIDKYKLFWADAAPKIYSDARIIESKYIVDGGEILSYFGDDRNLTIPEGVSAIATRAFHGARLNTVIIPSGVETINANAFDYVAPKYSSLSAKVLPPRNERLAFYLEPSARPFNWNTNWNQQGRAVVWGCTLSSDKSYVMSVTKTAGGVSGGGVNNLNNGNLPFRNGYTFGGWAAEEGSTTIVVEPVENPNPDAPLYRPLDFSTAGTTLYAIWLTA